MITRRPPAAIARSTFAGYRFPADVIVLAVRWYLRFGLSYRDVEALPAWSSPGRRSPRMFGGDITSWLFEEPANRRVAVAFDELAPAI